MLPRKWKKTWSRFEEYPSEIPCLVTGLPACAATRMKNPAYNGGIHGTICVMDNTVGSRISWKETKEWLNENWFRISILIILVWFVSNAVQLLDASARFLEVNEAYLRHTDPVLQTILEKYKTY